MLQPPMSAAWYFGRSHSPGTSKPGQWVRLCGADGACLEAAFCARTASCGPASVSPPPTAPRASPGVVVRSGLWEADDSLSWLTPCYPGDRDEAPLALLRCLWFTEAKGDLLPLGVFVASSLERAFASLSPPRDDAPPPPLPLRVPLCGPGLPSELRATFLSDAEAWLSEGDTLKSRIASLGASLGGGAASGAAGSASSGSLPPPGSVRLRRGFVVSLAAQLGEAEAADERCSSSPVTHLILTTHGIGHSLERVSMTEGVASLRDALSRASAASSSASAPAPPSCRALLLPVQWRKGLVLTGDGGAGLDALLPALPGAHQHGLLLPLRRVLTALTSDVLRYVGPDGAAMRASLAAALATAWARFTARNPSFASSPLSFSVPSSQTHSSSPSHALEHRVTLVAHSLGSVMAFDLLFRVFPSDAPCARPLPPISTLCLLGSPLGLFLALRDGGEGLRSAADAAIASSSSAAAAASSSASAAAATSSGDVFPPLHVPSFPGFPALVNVFHPTDPVAYRLEPLVLGPPHPGHFSSHRPLSPRSTQLPPPHPVPPSSARPTQLARRLADATLVGSLGAAGLAYSVTGRLAAAVGVGRGGREVRAGRRAQQATAQQAAHAAAAAEAARAAAEAAAGAEAAAEAAAAAAAVAAADGGGEDDDEAAAAAAGARGDGEQEEGACDGGGGGDAGGAACAGAFDQPLQLPPPPHQSASPAAAPSPSPASDATMEDASWARVRALAGGGTTASRASPPSVAPHPPPSGAAPPPPPPPPPPLRLDHVLRFTTLNPLLSALTSHLEYWRSPDLAQLVASFGPTPPPPTPAPQPQPQPQQHQAQAAAAAVPAAEFPTPPKRGLPAAVQPLLPPPPQLMEWNSLEYLG